MKHKTNITIRMKLILTYLVVLLVPSIIIGWQTYESASSKVEGQLLNNAAESVAAVNEIINVNMQSKINDIQYFAQQFSSSAVHGQAAGGGGAAVQARLKEYAALHPDVLDIYVATSRAEMVHAADSKLPENYDPRKENAYVSALKHGKGAVVSPAFQTVNGETAVAVSAVLEDGGGVVALNLNLEEMANLINIKVGKEGYIFWLTAAKNFLYILLNPLAKNHRLISLSKCLTENTVRLIIPTTTLPKS